MSTNAVERFSARAADIGIDIEVSEFPEGTRTAEDAAAAIGCDVAQIVKSLVFIADGDPVLVLTSGANRVDEAVMSRYLGATDFRKADAAEVRDATGYAIGGTPPFGHATAIQVVCDQDLTHHEVVWAAAGSPTSVFPLTPRLLLTATGAEIVDLARGELVEVPTGSVPDEATGAAIAALRDALPETDDDDLHEQRPHRDPNPEERNPPPETIWGGG